MRLLVLGGTVFLGRAVVTEALARGHAVTIFTRGRSGTDLFPGIGRLTGDRHGDLGALRQGTWDAVIDTSGQVPSAVRASASLLAGRSGHYTFVSSISVYPEFPAPGKDESAPVAAIPAEALSGVESAVAGGEPPGRAVGEWYGALKALCEEAAEEAMPGRVLRVRPGLIVGPNDPSDRFTYWPRRIARGGEVLAPGRPGRPVQLVDARDLAAWMVGMAERGATGVYNATGPAGILTMAGMLTGIREALRAEADFTWVPDDFLLERAVTPWTGLPLWVPESIPGMEHFMEVSCARALGAGLAFRSLGSTARDTLEWDSGRPQGAPRRAGIDGETERGVLEAWRGRREAGA